MYRWRNLWMAILRLLGFADTNLRESIEDVLEDANGQNSDFTLEERKMLRNLLDFRNLRVEGVMIPRADIVAISEMAGRAELLKQFIVGAHSRMPVYRETLDHPLGFVHIKDILKHLRTARRVKLSPLIREVLFVPPSMPALELLQKMQTGRTHMALVIDEYGGTDGLVTIEDLIEEIVGEIEDEHNAENGIVLKKVRANQWHVDARIKLDELEARLKISFNIDPGDEDEYDTLGGFICSLSGRVPQRGEIIPLVLEVSERGVEFVIRDADPRRIKVVEVRLVAAAQIETSKEPSA